MRSNYRYTNGESFTIGNIPYFGFFNVGDGKKAYTGKIKNDISEELTLKNTFLTESLMREFDNEDINETFSNVFDILNKQELTRAFNIIDENNIKIFKRLILTNSTFVDVNSTTFFGLSSSDLDTRANDELYGKNRRVNIDPFIHNQEWAFLNEVKYGMLMGQPNDEFIYISSSGKNLATIRGNFYDKSKLSLESFVEYNNEHIYGIHYNDPDNEIMIQYADEASVYDASSWISCQNILNENAIKLSGVFKQNNNVKFGNKLRITIIGNILTIGDKYSTDIIDVINLGNFDINNVMDFDIRNTDDLICVIYSDDQILIFEPLNFQNREISTLKDFTQVDRVIPELKNQTFLDNKRVNFSNFDSNAIFTSNFDEIEIRSLNNPSNVLSKTSKEAFNYPRNYKFGDTNQTWGGSILKWNTNTLKSNFFNNIFFFNGVDGGIHYYYMIHNIGRLYPIKAKLSDLYQYSIPPNLERTYDGVECGDSSVGIFFNVNIKRLLDDVLTIYNQATNTFNIDNEKIYNTIKEVDVDSRNMFINMNESINVVSIQRIFSKITEIQRAFL